MAKFAVSIEAESAEELRRELIRLLGTLPDESSASVDGKAGISPDEVARIVWNSTNENYRRFITELVRGNRSVDELRRTFEMSVQEFAGMLSGGGFARRLIAGRPEIVRFDYSSSSYQFASDDLEHAFMRLLDTMRQRELDKERNVAAYNRMAKGKVQA